MGSILVEIFHSVEGGGRRVRVLEPRNKSPVSAIALSLSLTCVYILHAYIAFIFICLIYSCAQIDLCLRLFAHTCIQPREP